MSESAPVKAECASARLLDEPKANLSKQSKKGPCEEIRNPDSMIVNPKQNKFLNMSFNISSASLTVRAVFRSEPGAKVLRLKPTIKPSGEMNDPGNKAL